MDTIPGVDDMTDAEVREWLQLALRIVLHVENGTHREWNLAALALNMQGKRDALLRSTPR